MLCAKYNVQSERTFETPCKCHRSVVYSKRDAKRAFKFSSDVARQYFNKRAIADVPFSHDGHDGRIGVQLFTSYVNTHFLIV